MAQTYEKIRAEFHAGDVKRDEGLMTPDDIERFDDIKYGEESELQVLDVYRPRAAKGQKLPVIMNVHGGAWVYGNKEVYQYYCMSLAQKGFAVVNFSYRLAPEWKYPCMVEDTNTVVHWILEHAQEYDFDTEHFFAVGDSAGAQLLAVYSCICTNPEYASTYQFEPPEGFCPTAVALNCGAYYFRRGGDTMDDGILKVLLPNGGTKEEELWITIAPYVTEKFPPAYVMTCSDDFLKEGGPFLTKVLTQNNVPNTFRFYGDNKKLLPHVFHCDIRDKDAQKCNEDECNFFKEFLD